MAEAEAIDIAVRQSQGALSEHIKQNFEDGELTPAATVRLFGTVQAKGVRDVARNVGHYKLDLVLA